jgi:hypothetical protein
VDRENKRIKALLSRTFSDAVVEELGADRSGALRLSLSGRFGNTRLRGVWIGAGWPADLQRALVQLDDPQPWPTDLVLLGQQMSPGTVALLEQRKANWADEAGSAWIVAPGAIVNRQGQGKTGPAQALSWTPATIAVAEALLARDWSAGVKTAELANLVQWSPGRVSNALQRFDEEGWTVKFGPQRGSTAVRELSDPAGLLDAWAVAAASQDRELRLAHRTMRSPLGFLEDELATALDDEVRWALSGWAAAHLLAPISDAVPSLQIYVHEDDFAGPLDRSIRAAGLTDVADGGRVAFFPAHPSILVLAQPRPTGAAIVSPPRVYADLLYMGGRGEDAALHLREEALDRTVFRSDRRQAPGGIVSWERDCRQRLHDLALDRPELTDAYARGMWSASYRLIGTSERPPARRLLAILREIAGHETDWPVWMPLETENSRPHLVEGAIECWLSDTTDFADAAHADYWRAEPDGRLCLIRGYQEDSDEGRMAATPQTRLDLTLPIWRTGECLLHAERLALRLDATSVQFMMRWTGLRNRRLATLDHPGRFVFPTAPSAQDEVISFVESSPAEIAGDLPGTVRRLVEPLYESFDFFEPAPTIYTEELATMRRRGGER